MKNPAYEKVGVREQAEYADPYRWQPLQSDFRINALGIHEVMPPLVVERPGGTGDFLFILFHDPVTVRSESVDAGSLVIWPHGDRHVYGREDAEWDHSWIHADGVWVKQQMEQCGIQPGSVMPLRKPLAMENCLWGLYTELTNYEKPDSIILKNIFQNWLRELMRDGDIDGTVPEHIRQVRQYLEQHAAGRITLRRLAERAELSIPHLSAEFRRYYGNSPIGYLIGLRLQQARRLLLTGNLPVGEIARCVGYDDIFHFSRLFKKHFGCSPRAMRNQSAG